MRAAAVFGLVVLLAGCLGPQVQPPPVDDVGGNAGATLVYHLKPQHQLSILPPASAAPQKVYAAPTANAYVNEDVEVFTSVTTASGFVARSIELDLFYAVERPTGDAFRNGMDVLEARHFVFWVGSDEVYPTFATVLGPPVLQPDVAYSSHLTFAAPPGGWHVAAGERIQLLVAPLVAEAGVPNLHYLVDHERADSRITLAVEAWDAPQLGPPVTSEENITVPGNSGLFTGAVPDEARSVERVLAIRPDDALVRVDVQWVSTQGGKSDLDMVLLDSAGAAVASSTTPYQSETIRLFAPQLAALGTGTFTVRVDAYSGVDTSFRLVITRAPPV